VENSLPTERERLTVYDLACGTSINAAFGWFQGMDPVPTVAPVFAALTHRLTGGRDDGSHNPLLVEGAGWVGFIGVTGERARFASLIDGCRAAALALQFQEYQSVQIAYRARDAVGLAEALEACDLQNGAVLAGLAAEVHALTRRTGAGAVSSPRRSFSWRLGGWGRKHPTAQVVHH
jgi:hypothetical protein